MTVGARAIFTVMAAQAAIHASQHRRYGVGRRHECSFVRVFTKGFVEAGVDGRLRGHDVFGGVTSAPNS
jgi:hypothetical protein